MNTAIDGTVTEMPPRTLTETGKGSVVVFSTSMDMCVSLQMALERQYEVTTVTELEMLIESVTTIKPDIVIIESSSIITMVRFLRRMKRATPSVRILFIASPRCLHLASVAALHPLLDGIFLEPVGVGELKNKMQSMLHEDVGEEEKLIGPGIHQR